MRRTFSFLSLLLALGSVELLADTTGTLTAHVNGRYQDFFGFYGSSWTNPVQLTSLNGGQLYVVDSASVWYSKDLQLFLSCDFGDDHRLITAMWIDFSLDGHYFWIPHGPGGSSNTISFSDRTNHSILMQPRYQDSGQDHDAGSSATLYFNADNTAPAISLGSNPSVAVNGNILTLRTGTAVNFSITDGGSGVKKTTVVINSDPSNLAALTLTPYTTTSLGWYIDTTNLPGGTYKFSVAAADNVGNLTTTQTYTLNNLAPKVNSISVDQGKIKVSVRPAPRF